MPSCSCPLMGEDGPRQRLQRRRRRRQSSTTPFSRRPLFPLPISMARRQSRAIHVSGIRGTAGGGGLERDDAASNAFLYTIVRTPQLHFQGRGGRRAHASLTPAVRRRGMARRPRRSGARRPTSTCHRRAGRGRQHPTATARGRKSTTAPTTMGGGTGRIEGTRMEDTCRTRRPVRRRRKRKPWPCRRR